MPTLALATELGERPKQPNNAFLAVLVIGLLNDGSVVRGAGTDALGIRPDKPAIVLLYEERPPFCHWFCPLPTVSVTLVLVTVAWALPQECSAKVSSSMSKGCSPNARLGDEHQSAGQIETE